MKQVEIHTRLLEALLECPVASDWQLIEGVPEATTDDGRWARNHLYDFVGIYEDKDGDLPHEPIRAHLPVWALVQNPTFDDDEVKQWIRLQYGVELRSSYLTEHAEMTRIRARRVDARLPSREARDSLEGERLWQEIGYQYWRGAGADRCGGRIHEPGRWRIVEKWV